MLADEARRLIGLLPLMEEAKKQHRAREGVREGRQAEAETQLSPSCRPPGGRFPDVRCRCRRAWWGRQDETKARETDCDDRLHADCRSLAFAFTLTVAL